MSSVIMEPTTLFDSGLIAPAHCLQPVIHQALTLKPSRGERTILWSPIFLSWPSQCPAHDPPGTRSPARPTVHAAED